MAPVRQRDQSDSDGYEEERLAGMKRAQVPHGGAIATGFNQQERGEVVERGKIALGRTPSPKGGHGALWWRVTVYLGDPTEQLDAALDEALRLDARLRAETDR